ncbi:UPF0691 protein C9orf116 homolog [Xenopus laevis]|uniref:UPF0691 protein C9orf116 homolog n=2 Tax=Xenopus laevis TaxID=8355 RepID=A0A1L8F128_XENLA|nr:UPF0691 protein C9orf116 homolog [Xenopus laevis]OCT65306.1 hypothetical protein XELAEV_18041545mg [Xenopus laevis]
MCGLVLCMQFLLRSERLPSNYCYQAVSGCYNTWCTHIDPQAINLLHWIPTMTDSPAQGPSSDPPNPEPLHPQTSDFYRVTEGLPAKFNHPEMWRRGYRPKVDNPLYRTSNQAYGSRPPTVHEMPTKFNGISDKFSEKAVKCGMYRNHGFNTSIEKSYVSGPDNLITAADRLNFHRSYKIAGPSH